MIDQIFFRTHFLCKKWLFVGALFAISLPFYSSPFVLHLAILSFLNTIMVYGLFLICRAGQLSLGHAAFVAIGAYASVILQERYDLPLWLTALLGIGLTALVGGLLGWVILRLRGVYFVLVTFAFGELVRLVCLQWSGITGGANGITNIAPIQIFGFMWQSRESMYLLSLSVLLIIIAAIYHFLKTPTGQAMDAVADNAALAESSGLNVHRIQVLAFVLGCVLAAIGGILQTRYIGFVSPESFNTSISIGFIIMLVVGGRNSIWGPLIGAMVLTPLPELFRSAVQSQHIFYGAVLIIILRFLPQGLSGFLLLVKRRLGKQENL